MRLHDCDDRSCTIESAGRIAKKFSRFARAFIPFELGCTALVRAAIFARRRIGVGRSNH